jgi:aminoglycoside phosphotransferase (APT) family kinase protein
MQSWLSQLATTQAAIHAVPDHPQSRWDGWYDDGAPLDWLADRGLREAAREAAAGPLVEEKVLVHGDYQHFNVLCCDDRLSGVVDWPNAALATGAATSAIAGSTWRFGSTPGQQGTIW